MKPKSLLALALCATLALTGCGSGASGPDPVKLLVFGAPEELGAYRTLIEAYQDARPGERVQLIEASDRKDLLARLATSVAGGAPPDVFLMNYRFYGQFAAKGVVEPLDQRIAGSTLDPADYHPVAMDAFKWEGAQLCLPQNVSSLAVYYNRTLFTRYGVPEPKAGWTWNDLVGTATAMTRDARGLVIKGTEAEGAARLPAVHGLGVEPSIIRLAPLVWSNGGEIVDDPVKPTRLALDSPAAREALKNLIDLRQAYGVVPSDAEVEAEDDESRFLNGRLAMLMTSRRATTNFRTITGFEWDVAPMPVYRQPVGVLHSDAYCMTTGSKNKDAAWRFMEYAMSADGQRIIAATGRTVPSHIEVSRSPAFLDPDQPPRNSQVFLDAIPTVRALPTVSTWPEIEDLSYGILENAIHRGDRLDDVIRELDVKSRPMFARGEHG
ncbi:ABC transporter substrate-binding protein [Micromonospora endophytica]|uniref:ABC transporter substrate-binding protein n=1 Tax=Micromonospora endophytica TaxID=515350 RepID=A0A2W2C8S2_9ACTN|nr:sugar ABC transporter substrate-binding protein [Micromonospora endophytica]PZF95072.1 ABC transporter substrate-binding protein [Micromonospora endophytica]RIW41322.1 sugar ABC transporter substrate-binding protein [Micromonospora endophytica]BCJ62702.1 ABC transporter substrate-binding protein [Micromonospora endophytica]